MEAAANVNVPRHHPVLPACRVHRRQGLAAKETRPRSLGRCRRPPSPRAGPRLRGRVRLHTDHATKDKLGGGDGVLRLPARIQSRPRSRCSASTCSICRRRRWRRTSTLRPVLQRMSNDRDDASISSSASTVAKGGKPPGGVDKRQATGRYLLESRRKSQRHERLSEGHGKPVHSGGGPRASANLHGVIQAGTRGAKPTI